jgi:hypothetical protein
MIVDFFTKPLQQGTLFQKFRNFIMNVDPLTNSPQDHRSVLRNVKDPEDPNGRKADETANAREPLNDTKPKPDMDGWTKVKRGRKF